MLRVLAIIAVLIGSPALATEYFPGAQIVDLNDSAAVEQLKQTRPAHYAKIEQILRGLQEQPQRAEGDWLQATFHATNVDLSRFMLKTSYPPKQLLQFTLDDVRYQMHLTRSDMTGNFVPAH